jgi:[acyl-carrier-protein] S-malonyltransferase
MDKSKIAVLFPGQGSQALEMGKALAEAEHLASETFQQAESFLGFPLTKLCWDGPVEELNETVNTQPALLTHSIAVWRVLRSRYADLQIHYAAGHSVGEISALVAVGSLSFEDGLHLVRERGLAMQEAGRLSPGGMAAILGIDVDQVAALCQEIETTTGAGIWVANDNCPGQVVISGENRAIEGAEEVFRSAGARKYVRLAVSIPAHSPLMIAAQERFNQALQAIEIKNPLFPIIGNVSADYLHTADDIRDDLRAQLTSQVRWTESMGRFISDGVTSFLEIGSGSVLKGLMRRIERKMPVIALDSPDSFSAFSS